MTSPKGLSEILVTKVYDFEKPALVRESLGRLTGQKGVLLVEGAEHKASVTTRAEITCPFPAD